jgi:hypothetical protein
MGPRPSNRSRRPAGLLGAGLFGVLALLLLLAPPAGAQDEPREDEAAAEAPGAAEEEGGVPDIEAILEGDEEVLGGGGYTYDPGDRRDPFKSLLQARENDERQGPRPEGIPGLLIDEITISGIFRTPRGWVAQVQAANQNKSYLIKVDDQLYDGDVLSISGNEVVFKQIVQDPTALKPFREVVKKLNP